MNKNQKILLVRSGYWFGILADGLWAVALFYPALRGALTGIPDFAPIFQHRLDMAVAASFMDERAAGSESR